MDANEYIENFENFLKVLQSYHIVDDWSKIDDQNYAVKIIKPADKITLLSLNPFWDRENDNG